MVAQEAALASLYHRLEEYNGRTCLHWERQVIVIGRSWAIGSHLSGGRGLIMEQLINNRTFTSFVSVHNFMRFHVALDTWTRAIYQSLVFILQLFFLSRPEVKGSRDFVASSFVLYNVNYRHFCGRISLSFPSFILSSLFIPFSMCCKCKTRPSCIYENSVWQ